MTYGTVESVEPLGTSMVRVVFGGEGLADFAALEDTDAYLMMLFRRPDSPAVPFDAQEALALPRERRPIPRRFTVRRWAENKLTVDFVVHGDIGVAGRWAQSAQPGDRLQFRGPSGGYRPSPDADWHLFVGDESALPAIAASVEALPAGVPAVVVGLVDAASDELEFNTAADLRTVWVHRPDSLPDAVAALDFPEGQVHGFVHGEANETRAIRRHLLADRGIDPEALSLSPYWRRGDTDEAWRVEKREFLAAQAADV